MGRLMDQERINLIIGLLAVIGVVLFAVGLVWCAIVEIPWSALSTYSILMIAGGVTFLAAVLTGMAFAD